MSPAAIACNHKWVNGREDPPRSGSYLSDCKACGKTRRFGVGAGASDVLDLLKSVAKENDRRFVEASGIRKQIEEDMAGEKYRLRFNEVTSLLINETPHAMFAIAAFLHDEAMGRVIEASKNQRKEKSL